MDTPNLTFNLLTFTHPQESLTLWFTNQEQDGLCRIFHTLVPDEVRDKFGEHEHFYTSFEEEHDGFIAVTKNTKPIFEYYTDEDGEERREMIENSAFTRSVLRRYYNTKIYQYFKDLGYYVKPNFVDDIEVWFPKKQGDIQYNYFEKFTLRVQFARITKQPELVISSDGISRVFKKSVLDFLSTISPDCFNWVIHEKSLYKYDELPDKPKMELDKVFPVWNFDMRDALQLPTERPDRANKYTKFKSKIDTFYEHVICKNGFKEIIPIDSNSYIPVKELKISSVKDKSNELLFFDQKPFVVPFKGMQHGPYKASDYSNIQFFYIFHKDDTDIAKVMHKYFDKGIYSFNGLYQFARIPYNTQDNFSIVFTDKNNPIDEIERELVKREFKDGVHYFAIYLSPHSKHHPSREIKSLYYKVKELLLKRDITSQAIDVEKVKDALASKSRYDYSLNNIAIAILAKLDGIPWQLNTKTKNELIVGVGAFRHVDTDVQYLGSAFSFANNGRFKRFECFQKDQTEELAGSILDQIKEYVSINTHISRLIIHFYKNMSKKELEPIEQGLNNLDLDIPVFIVSINKTESRDIVAFDNNSKELMPMSGTYINVGRNQYLLFNNVRYNHDSKIGAIDGHPFPIKLSIRCTYPEEAKDPKIVRELINQVYQFSRMYWKSVRQQNLPVTIKYPEMVAEIFPHFSGHEIPEFGKDNLWFL